MYDKSPCHQAMVSVNVPQAISTGHRIRFLEITTAQRILEFPGSTRPILSLIRSRWTLSPSDWHQGIRIRPNSCPSEIIEKPVIAFSPNSTIRRLSVHRETISIWVIFVHVKPDDLRWRRTSSVKYLARPTLPTRMTSGVVAEYTASFVQFNEWCPIRCACKRRIFPSISFCNAL